MFEELNNRRRAVEQNIAKSFVDETDLEKARQKKTFAIGDTFTRHGITYRCTGISPATGRPTWSKVKDDSSKQEAAETGKQYKKFADDVQKEPEEKQDCAIEWMEFTFNGGIKKKRKEFDSQAKARSFMDKLFTKDSFYQITATSGLDGDKAYKEEYPDTPEGREQEMRDVMNDAGERIKKQMKEKNNSDKKLSDLEVGDEVTIVTDNKGKITKKNAKITKVNSASFEVGGERFFKRTGYHVGMDNVKIEI